jgi:hypothetical protein
VATSSCNACTHMHACSQTHIRTDRLLCVCMRALQRSFHLHSIGRQRRAYGGRSHQGLGHDSRRTRPLFDQWRLPGTAGDGNCCDMLARKPNQRRLALHMVHGVLIRAMRPVAQTGTDHRGRKDTGGFLFCVYAIVHRVLVVHVWTRHSFENSPFILSFQS